MAPDLMASGSDKSPCEVGTQQSGLKKLRQRIQVNNPLTVEGHSHYVEPNALWINEGKLLTSEVAVFGYDSRC